VPEPRVSRPGELQPITIRSRTFDFSRTYVVGIVNVTPDSFSDGGEHFSPAEAIEHALRLEAEGADILDIGGESTRPGAEPVGRDEELRRVLPVIAGIRQESDIPISIDTYKAKIAETAFSAGADMVNDISGMRFDPDMARIAAKSNAAVILMHIRGTPRSMQTNPVYNDLLGEISHYLEESISIAERAGVDRTRIILDPGIGFGKTFEHNFTILKNLEHFRSLGQPLLIGASRKSFLGSISGAGVADRLAESVSAAVLASAHGANFLRVHDVAFTRRALAVHDKIQAAQ